MCGIYPLSSSREAFFGEQKNIHPSLLSDICSLDFHRFNQSFSREKKSQENDRQISVRAITLIMKRSEKETFPHAQIITIDPMIQSVFRFFSLYSNYSKHLISIRIRPALWPSRERNRQERKASIASKSSESRNARATGVFPIEDAIIDHSSERKVLFSKIASKILQKRGGSFPPIEM